MEAALAGPLGGKPVERVLVTHHHPDHIGLAGWFRARGAELLMTRTAYLMARMLALDVQERPVAEAIAFYESAGAAPDVIAKRKEERPFNFADVIHPLPLGFTRVRDGDEVTLGGRRWRVREGNGHAPEHATLWSEDDHLILGGDQLLPSISPNLGRLSDRTGRRSRRRLAGLLRRLSATRARRSFGATGPQAALYGAAHAARSDDRKPCLSP